MSRSFYESLPKCSWRDDGENNYETQCGHEFSLFDGTPGENNFNDCPGCSFTIKLVEVQHDS